MLEARGLCKRYSGAPVLNDVSFILKPGEVTGYLGPNGAGKSTTVKILTGLLQPTEGQVLWNGQDVSRCLIEFKARLGYVPEEPLLYPFLTGTEYLQLVGRLRGIPEKILAGKIGALMSLFSLHHYRYSALSSYSKGMQQKVLLAAALLHNPDLLILDEPLSGLDVTSSLIVRNLIRSLPEPSTLPSFLCYFPGVAAGIRGISKPPDRQITCIPIRGRRPSGRRTPRP